MSNFDLVIRGGKVVDGTGNPWFWGDVGIRNGRIARIGRLDASDGQRTVEVDGMVVCPGFIDMHTHSDTTILADGEAHSKIRQGVTLDIIGESNSVTPITGYIVEEYREEYRRRTGVEVDWEDYAGYTARIRRQGISMNVASCIAPQQVKRAVVGFESRPATAEEQQRMNDLVARAMEQGCVGLTTAWHGGGPEFPDEVVEMARVAASYGGYYGTHVGSEGYEMDQELEKAIYVGRQAEIPVHVYHLKARGHENWGRVGWIIETIEAARRDGLDVTANQYPYTAMQHPWHRLVPRFVQDAPRKEIIPRFADPAFRAEVRQHPEFVQYVAEHGGWENIVLTVAYNPALKQYEGKTVTQIAELRGQSDPVEVCFDLIAEDGNFPHGVYHNMSEESVQTIMRCPWVSIGSDGSALNVDEPGYPHPRSFGTNARVLGRYVRETGNLRLEDAIRKMTSLPAQVLRLPYRGLLREGYWADLAVFDPARIADRATFDQPKQYAVGVEYVVVNGQLVIDRSNHTGARPGQVVTGAQPVRT